MAQSSSFPGPKLTTSNYGSWHRSFEDFLASLAERDGLLVCLEEELPEAAAAATRASDRRVLGLLRNACTSALAVHVDNCETACEA